MFLTPVLVRIEFAAKRRQSSPLHQYDAARLRGVAAAVGDWLDQSARRTGGPAVSGEVQAAAVTTAVSRL